MTPDAEVVVAGGGPAGSAAAFALARAGRDVLVVDHCAFPRDKPCGDLIGTEAVAILRALSLEGTLAGGFTLEGAILYGPDGRSAGCGEHARKRRAGDARVVPRRDFDARLLERARAGGAAFTQARVLGLLHTPSGQVAGARTTAGDVRARVVIGAEGWGSTVARGLGARFVSRAGTALVARTYVHGVTELGPAMRFYVNVPAEGYAWIFPLGDGQANVGAGFITGESGASEAHVRGNARDARAALERFFSERSLAAPFLHGARRAETAAWPIPLGWQDGPFAVPGAYLAGDAAQLASPLSGSGIHHALASGTGAARFALAQLAGNEHAARHYDAWVRWRFGVRLRAEAFAHRVAGTPGRIGPWLAVARSVPGGGSALSRALLALG